MAHIVRDFSSKTNLKHVEDFTHKPYKSQLCHASLVLSNPGHVQGFIGIVREEEAGRQRLAMATLLDEEHGQKKGQSVRELAEQVVRKKER
jgi:molybdopterin synthase catalytic subunit